MGALLQGFTAAYDRMDQHYRQQENNNRYQEQQQVNTQRYNDGMQRQQGLDAMAKQSHEMQMQTGGLNMQVAQNQVDRLPQQNAYADEIQGINKQGALLNNQAKEYDLGTAKENKGKASKEEKQVRAAQKLKAYSVSGKWDQMVSDPDFEGTDAELIFSGVGRKAAVGLADSISKQDWGSATQSFNKLYKPKLNKMVGSKGRDGLKILDVEATGFEVQEDGSVKIPVYVTTEKGKGYTSYISELRSSDENDPHKQFNVDELIGKAASLGQLATIMESSGVNSEMTKRANTYIGSGQKQQQIPAQAQNVQYMAQAMGITPGEAWQLTMNAKENPQALQLAKVKFIQSQLENNEDLKYKLSSDETDQQYAARKQKALSDASATFDGIIGANASGSGLQTGAPTPTPAPNPKLQAVLQQAKAAIDSGKDRNAVIQRLVEMGVPQDQINL
jgi:hypothetical protein